MDQHIKQFPVFILKHFYTNRFPLYCTPGKFEHCCLLNKTYKSATPQFLPVVTEKIIAPGIQAFLYNIAHVKNKQQPKVLAAASRAYDEKVSAKSYSFITKSPSKTQNVMRIQLPSKPKEIIVRHNVKQPLPDFKKLTG